MNSFKYITIILFALAMLAGCGMRQRNNMGMSPAERAQLIIQGMNPQVAATATATSAMSTTGAVAPQPKPAPKPVGTRPVGQAYTISESEIEASDTMSVKISNPTKLLACLHSQQIHGIPVLRPRVGYPQDVLPSLPDWRVSCTAVLMPNPGRYDRSAPEVWLATREVGNFKLWATFYSWDIQNPRKIPELTFSVDLTFPNTPSTNGYCMAGNRGCLWEIMIQAANFDFNAEQTRAYAHLMSLGSDSTALLDDGLWSKFRDGSRDMTALAFVELLYAKKRSAALAMR